jgi:hypothetical protein
MPALALAVRGHLGSRTKFLDFDRGYLCHANSVHRAATTGHNIHEMNIDRFSPILQVLIVDFGRLFRNATRELFAPLGGFDLKRRTPQSQTGKIPKVNRLATPVFRPEPTPFVAQMRGEWTPRR